MANIQGPKVPTGGNKFLLPALIGVAVIGIGGFTYLNFFGDKAASGNATSTATKVVAPVIAGADAESVPKLLEAASLQFKANHFFAPAGQSAIELYLKVLEKEPSNSQASISLLELMPYATDQASNLIAEGKLDEATAAVALLRKADPGYRTLSSLEARISKMQVDAKKLADQAIAAANRPTPVATVPVAPVEPSVANPTGPTTATTDTPLSTAPATTPGTRTPAPGARPATPRNTTPADTTPKPTLANNTEPTPSVADQTSAENRPAQLIKSVQPSYPTNASRKRIEGWVELTYTVSESGDVSDVRVLDAKPKREFDREAIRAIEGFKYRPKIENGRAVATTDQRRIVFKLADN
jgi:periplasmic protein TonB